MVYFFGGFLVGRRFEVQEKTPRLLDDFLVERRVYALEAVTPVLIDESPASRPRSNPESIATYPARSAG